MNKLVGVFIVGVMLGGCETVPSHQVDSISDANDQMVSACKFVGSVSGTSGVGGMAASTGIVNAKNEAKGHAYELGATHIVWRTINGGFTPNVMGEAYQCK